MKDYLSNFKKVEQNIYQDPNHNGYWSNLSKIENDELIGLIDDFGCKEAIKKLHPELLEIIFSEKRIGGLELLQLAGTETIIDLGCMWGALSIPMARRVKNVFAVDQTLDSLKFMAKRAQEEKLKNISFINANLRDFQIPSKTFDLAIVNGVLEWIPETLEVVVDEYLDMRKKDINSADPRSVQLEFLKKIRSGLTEGGRLYLAIENRYDYKMFFGEKDPHSGLLLTSVFPKFLANKITKFFRGRDYKTWIYSFSETKELLEQAGFQNFEIYSCWPDYRMPDYITPHGIKSQFFRPINPRKKGKLKFKRLVANRIEWVLFKLFNLQFFAPSMIIIAK